MFLVVEKRSVIDTIREGEKAAVLLLVNTYMISWIGQKKVEKKKGIVRAQKLVLHRFSLS